MSARASLRDRPESELVALAATGAADAFGELVRRSAPQVRGVLRRIGAGAALADDLMQDAFLVGFQRLHTYRGEGAFCAWVTRIAARLYIQRRRADSRTLSLEEVPEHTSLSRDETGKGLDLDDALQGLPPNERLCVSLCHGAGYSPAELSSLLDMPLGTVKSHIRRGLIRLRGLMDVEKASAEQPE